MSRPDYRLVPFTHDFGAALAAADLALCRAGGSIYELAAAGKPAVLVPYPHATADHQTKNARDFAEAGAAVVVPDAEIAACPSSCASCWTIGRGSRSCPSGCSAVARPAPRTRSPRS